MRNVGENIISGLSGIAASHVRVRAHWSPLANCEPREHGGDLSSESPVPNTTARRPRPVQRGAGRQVTPSLSGRLWNSLRAVPLLGWQPVRIRDAQPAGEPIPTDARCGLALHLILAGIQRAVSMAIKPGELQSSSSKHKAGFST